MTSASTPTLLIVPGLRDHVEDHWQTILARKLPNTRVIPPLEHDKLNCAARVAALDQALADITGPVVLVAHSAGVMITVHWAQHHNREIHGALLAAPPDFESPLPQGYPTIDALRENGWLPAPRTRLPFPSIVAASTNDPLARFEKVTELANAWGSRLVDVGAVGHLNPASGFGEWPRAVEFVNELI
ncbi:MULTISPECIES: RBBP9/YdeN family alpha/beta hydrolase [Pandoraea]|uniref:RBBP9/YdeN family alpha/beta hydrolase n=1 Tax=Pandoraea TaxID=93217 RepID=UPI0003C7744D|nr:MULTISPECIES: alpha/beta hydrolase [Pandoraea]AHB04838.1 alpha/beta hydrolase [Pandoraea pnomenusa 3kgm]AHB74763.1 alpha/beta hydrolase [Pandoraea pnomenusa]AHN76865.1 alpha/beta hydrolase [Pandoraea pnomenusa]